MVSALNFSKPVKPTPPMSKPEIFNGLTEAEETRRGLLIASILHLKPIAVKDMYPAKDFGRYHTAWGTKTALGLFRTVERIIKDGE